MPDSTTGEDASGEEVVQLMPDELEASSLKDGDARPASGDVNESDNVDEESSAQEEDSSPQQNPTAQETTNIGGIPGIEEERAQHEESLKREIRAREELEDMLLRMETHFKSEQEARKRAEELLEQAVQAELSTKKELEGTLQRHSDEAQELELERESTRRERQELDSMRQDFESELQAARTEVAKAQDALKTAEDRVRCSERIEMAKMEAEYQMRLTSLGNELERVREELVIRTQTLGEEMERWRMQAEYAAAAIIEAKSEVMDRKRDLDVTRERMDRLVEKLFSGREHGLVLQGAISAAQMYNGQAQSRLLASMQNTYYNAVQVSLPWGGEIAQSNGIQALPSSGSKMTKPDLHAHHLSHNRTGAQKFGKAAAGVQEYRQGKSGHLVSASLPPLGSGGMYLPNASKPSQKGARTKTGLQAKKQQNPRRK